ncbi:MAG TPA: ABC transporter substrate-binding protein [Acidimicrobiales bacterium]|jgi:hypothetical protein
MQEFAGARPRKALGLWWGYLPLVVVGGLFAAMVWVVPSDLPDGTTAARDVREVGAGEPATGWNDSVTACASGQQWQVEADTYSPPCFDFSGDNGGATSRGVTADEITLSYRMTSDPNLLKVLADTAGIELDVTNEQLENDAEGLVDYFNQNYQFYGRKLRLQQVQGSGSVIEEFTGGGQDKAVTDAIKVAQETKAFADVTALTQPYADALSDQHVVNIGAPYMSREWFGKRAPYAWSNFPDCSTAAETATEVAAKEILPYPAKYAGGDLTDRPRTLGVVAPNNQEYQQCVEAGRKILEDQGFHYSYETDYVLDLASIPDAARDIVAQLKDKGITSVALACDPVMAASLLSVAESQNYKPEWLVLGVAFTDLDLVGQIIQKNSGDQMSRAFGGTPYGGQEAYGTSYGYQAFKSVRPDEEPSILIDVIFIQLLEMAIGIQMAGPDLTPEHFETGMFSYPERTGTAGTWDFSPEHYTGVRDIRLVWWDPNRPSPFNGANGTYVDDGTRIPQGQVPESEMKVFQ